MPEGKLRTNFEPAMILSLDHLKKDDLQFDLDAEIARFKAQRAGGERPPVNVRANPKPRAPGFETELK